jgi:hypothetical protein
MEHSFKDMTWLDLVTWTFYNRTCLKGYALALINEHTLGIRRVGLD